MNMIKDKKQKSYVWEVNLKFWDDFSFRGYLIVEDDLEMTDFL